MDCLILGTDYHTFDVVKFLSSSEVTCRSVPPTNSNATILEMCRREPGLVVIGVFCKDFPNEAVDLLQIIRKAFLKVKIHAFYESKDSPKGKYDQLAKEVLSGFPMRPGDVASVIKRGYFPSKPDEAFEKKLAEARTREPKKPPTPVPDVIPVVEPRRRASLPAMPIRQEVAAPPPKRDPAPVTPKPSPSPVQERRPASVATAVAEKVVLPKQPAPPASQTEEVAEVMNRLDHLLVRIKKNSRLPKDPLRVDISGLANNTSVELDPRRVKPLPDNPRWVTNPGFRPDSLRRLGQSMKTVGQAEKVLVCPLVGDPDYDAQLLDGERRLRASLMVGIMLHADIRPEITTGMKREMYLLSVVRNTEKEPHTTLENVGMVMKLRGPEYDLTMEEVASFFRKSVNWVVQHQMLGKLHPDVLLMLDEGSDGSAPERRLTSQLALLLYDINHDKQLSVANEIIARKMNYNQARRHVLNVRRGLGLKDNAGGKNRSAQHFQALETLTKRSIDAFGVFLDMPTAEMTVVLANRATNERNALADSLRELVGDLEGLIKKVEMKVR